VQNYVVAIAHHEYQILPGITFGESVKNIFVLPCQKELTCLPALAINSWVLEYIFARYITYGAINRLLVRSNDYLYTHPVSHSGRFKVWIINCPCSTFFIYVLGRRPLQMSSLHLPYAYYSTKTARMFEGKLSSIGPAYRTWHFECGPFSRTNSLLNTLMLYTICTGMLTGYVVLFIRTMSIRPDANLRLYTAVLVVVVNLDLIYTPVASIDIHLLSTPPCRCMPSSPLFFLRSAKVSGFSHPGFRSSWMISVRKCIWTPFWLV